MSSSPVGGGPISPDGKHQWDGEKWIPIPAPPRKSFDFAPGEVWKVALLVLIVFVLLMLVLSAMGA